MSSCAIPASIKGEKGCEIFICLSDYHNHKICLQLHIAYDHVMNYTLSLLKLEGDQENMHIGNNNKESTYAKVHDPHTTS